MASPEKRENSVLFSLRELRQIEEKRVEEEDQAARSAEEARVRAKMEDERRKREEEDAKVRAVEEAERRVRDEQDRRIRDDQLRLEEAERRARVEAQANLDAQRLTHEMELRRHEISKKRPVGLMIAAGVLLLAIVGLGIFLYNKNQESNEKDAQIAAQRQEIADREAAIATLGKQLSDLNGQLGDLDKNIASAQQALNGAVGVRQQQEAQRRIDDLNAHKAEIQANIERTQKAQEEKRKEKAKIKIDPKCAENPLGC